jgi:DNA-binding SARP family transcriptional activator
MYAAAPRLDRRLLEAIARVDSPSESIAETYRRSRELAAELGIPRPSYESVRQYIHILRRERERRRKARQTLIEVALYLKPVDALYDVIDAE